MIEPAVPVFTTVCLFNVPCIGGWAKGKKGSSRGGIPEWRCRDPRFESCLYQPFFLLRRQENASQSGSCKMFPLWGTAYCDRMINKTYTLFPSHVSKPTRIFISDMLHTLSYQRVLKIDNTCFWFCRCRFKFNSFLRHFIKSSCTFSSSIICLFT